MTLASFYELTYLLCTCRNHCHCSFSPASDIQCALRSGINKKNCSVHKVQKSYCLIRKRAVKETYKVIFFIKINLSIYAVNIKNIIFNFYVSFWVGENLPPHKNEQMQLCLLFCYLYLYPIRVVYFKSLHRNNEY